MPLKLCLAGLSAAFAFAVYQWRRVMLLRAEKGILGERLAKIEKELQDMKAGPLRIECRVERFELIWYPVITASKASNEILSVVPGVPHCTHCVVPLTAAGNSGEWSCPLCRAKHPASISDIMALDVVSKEAMRYFLERHKGYRLPAKKKS